MATTVFNGSGNVTLNNFNPNFDQVVLENFQIADVDTFQTENGSAVLRLVNGTTLTIAGQPLENLRQTPGATTNGNNFIAGTGTNLAILVGSGGGDTNTANLAVGLGGDDSITAGGSAAAAADALIYGNTGNDTIRGADGVRQWLYGGQGADLITNFAQRSVVYGGLNIAGVDTITATAAGTGEGVTIYGGNGQNDSIDGADLITGSNANDVIYGNGGNDTINGLAGGDSIYGGQGNDSITLASASGMAMVWGGLGLDTIDASGSTAGVTIYGGNGMNDSMDGADTIIDGAGSDVIYGNGGNDLIDLGTGGRDSVFGGQGDDSIFSGAGTVEQGSVIYGGLGQDTIDVSVAASGTNQTVIYGGNGASDAADAADVIDLSGSAAQLVVYGNGGNDVITLGGSNDTVYGGAGDDTINIGTGGRDEIYGNAGADTLIFAAGASDATQVPAPNGTPTTLDTVFGFNFAEDEIRFTGSTVTDVVVLSVDSVTSLAQIDALNSTSGRAAVITVQSGDYAGTYVDVGSNLVELVGATGTVNLNAFN